MSGGWVVGFTSHPLGDTGMWVGEVVVLCSGVEPETINRFAVADRRSLPRVRDQVRQAAFFASGAGGWAGAFRAVEGASPRANVSAVNDTMLRLPSA